MREELWFPNASSADFPLYEWVNHSMALIPTLVEGNTATTHLASRALHMILLQTNVNPSADLWLALWLLTAL